LKLYSLYVNFSRNTGKCVGACSACAPSTPHWATFNWPIRIHTECITFKIDRQSASSTHETKQTGKTIKKSMDSA